MAKENNRPGFIENSSATARDIALGLGVVGGLIGVPMLFAVGLGTAVAGNEISRSARNRRNDLTKEAKKD